MPTYDYVCDECGISFERFQRMTDRIMRKCPECGIRKLRRLIGSGAGVIFKGSGFYETDYKRKSGASSDKAADKSESKSDSSSSSDTKSESKPDKKAKDTKSSDAESKD